MGIRLTFKRTVRANNETSLIRALDTFALAESLPSMTEAFSQSTSAQDNSANGPGLSCSHTSPSRSSRELEPDGGLGGIEGSSVNHHTSSRNSSVCRGSGVGMTRKRKLENGIRKLTSQRKGRKPSVRRLPGSLLGHIATRPLQVHGRSSEPHEISPSSLPEEKTDRLQSMETGLTAGFGSPNQSLGWRRSVTSQVQST